MIRVKLAPPTLGVRSMAGLLGQPLEYYYYYCSIHWIYTVWLLTEAFNIATATIIS